MLPTSEGYSPSQVVAAFWRSGWWGCCRPSSWASPQEGGDGTQPSQWESRPEERAPQPWPGPAWCLGGSLCFPSQLRPLPGGCRAGGDRRNLKQLLFNELPSLTTAGLPAAPSPVLISPVGMGWVFEVVRKSSACLLRTLVL